MTSVAIGSTANMAREGYSSKRTEAVPKTSLFGSSLEIQDGENTRRLREIDPTKIPKTPPVKGKGLKFELPPEVKKQLPGSHVLEKSKRDFDTQKNLVNETVGNLRKKEEDIFYHLAKAGVEQQGGRPQNTARSQWFTEQDLEGAKDINIVGLNKNQSYNRDKYGRQPPVHNYSLIGDLLKPGMDFLRRERTDVQMRNLGIGKGDCRGVLAEGNKPPSRSQQSRGPQSAREASKQKAVLDLPPNIKHQFGSRVCDKLLSDSAVVEKAIKQRDEKRANMQRPSKPFSVPKFTKEMNPEYEMLGNALRMNIVPGYTTDHKISTTKTEFNDQVHLFRYQDPDKWRYQKDELSKWAEHNVLRQRMTKAWEAYFLETLEKKKAQ